MIKIESFKELWVKMYDGQTDISTPWSKNLVQEQDVISRFFILPQ